MPKQSVAYIYHEGLQRWLPPNSSRIATFNASKAAGSGQKKAAKKVIKKAAKASHPLKKAMKAIKKVKKVKKVRPEKTAAAKPKPKPLCASPGA